MNQRKKHSVYTVCIVDTYLHTYIHIEPPKNQGNITVSRFSSQWTRATRAEPNCRTAFCWKLQGGWWLWMGPRDALGVVGHFVLLNHWPHWPVPGILWKFGRLPQAEKSSTPNIQDIWETAETIADSNSKKALRLPFSSFLGQCSIFIIPTWGKKCEQFSLVPWPQGKKNTPSMISTRWKPC